MIILSFFLLGCTTWTLSEYVLHRFIGHRKKGAHGFTKEHRAHHVDGNHFMPLYKKIVISAKVILPLTFISIFFMHLLPGISFSIGFTSCFVLYEFLHKRAHTHAPQTHYGRWLRKHHFYHHFGAPNKNFGVTTPIWDIVFQTYTTTQIVRLPSKKAMTWLINNENGEIHPCFREDYQLRTKAKPKSS